MTPLQKIVVYTERIRHWRHNRVVIPLQKIVVYTEVLRQHLRIGVVIPLQKIVVYTLLTVASHVVQL